MTEKPTTGKPLVLPTGTGYTSGNGTGRVQIAPRDRLALSPYRPGGGRPLCGNEPSPAGVASNPPLAPALMKKIQSRLDTMAKNRDEILTILYNVAAMGEGRVTQAAMDRLTEELVQSVVGILGSVSHADLPPGPPSTPYGVRRNTSFAASSPTGKNLLKGISSLFYSNTRARAVDFPVPEGVAPRDFLSWLVRTGYARLGKTMPKTTSRPHFRKHLQECARVARVCLASGYTAEDLLRVASLAADTRRERGNASAIKWMGNLALLWREKTVRNMLIVEDHSRDLPAPKLRKASAVILRTGADRDRWMAKLRENWGTGTGKNPPVGA